MRATVNRPGTACTRVAPSWRTLETRKPPRASPQGRVYGNRSSTKVSQAVAEQEAQTDGDDVDDMPEQLERPELARESRAVLARLEPPADAGLGLRREPGPRPSRHPPDEPKDEEEGRGCADRREGFSKQETRRPRFADLFQRPAELRRGLVAHLVEGLAGQIVHVGRKDPEHVGLADADGHEPLDEATTHGTGLVAGDQLVQVTDGGRRTFRGRTPEDPRP